MVVLGLGLLFAFGRAPQALTETLPVPNGFHALVKAETEWSRATNSADKLALIGILRAGLAQESQLPLATVREAFQALPTPSSKDLTLGLVELAEAELAAGRIPEAVRLWTDALRFGQARVKGGTVLQLLVAIAGEKRVLESVDKHRERLSPAERRELAATLRSLEDRWEPVPVVFARDLGLGLERSSSPSQRLGQRWAMFWLGSVKKAQSRVTAKIHSEAQHRALVATKLEQ